MGNCCSCSLSACDPLISRCLDCTAAQASYICFMEDNVETLRRDIRHLQASKKDVQTKVDLAEQEGLKRLERVGWWMSRVEEVEVEVNELITASGDEVKKLCIGGACSKNCISSYKFGKQVAAKLTQVNALMNSLPAEVAGEAVDDPEDSRPTDETVGMQSMFDKVWNQLQERQVGIVGLFGMGGVGKTTLLDKIYNMFQETQNDFDHIIRVVVSRNHKIEDIQNDIGRKIRCLKRNSETHQHKDSVIRSALRGKKFVLLLDDVWRHIDLKNEVGVPDPHITNSKVLFTTRDEEVCNQMGGKKHKVMCLAWEDAWSLFKQNVNKVEDILSLDPEIPDLAKSVARKCAGLPLALIIVGRVMSCRKTAGEWREALRDLRTSAAKFEGIKDKVFHLLKFSYDNLASNKLKSCFLYCALYPEDFSIHRDELIYKWMGEEMLDEYDDVTGALDQGNHIIGTLVNACLLDDIEGHVKMHDVIREMALWLACHLEETKDNFLVEAGALLTEVPIAKIEKVQAVKRVSLMANDIEILEKMPSCSNLLTLFLGSNRLKTITQHFFDSMLSLQVLDLSKNMEITQLPSGISRLVSLKYLDLSETSTKELPIEFKAFVKLIYLNLEHTSQLDVIPQNVISSFSELRVLRMYNSGVCKSALVGHNEHLERELQLLKNLSMLTFTIQSDSGFQKFFTSSKLLSCTQFLCLDGLKLLNISSLTKMKRPYSLAISGCESIDYNLDVRSQSRFGNLKVVDIHDSPNLRDLTWLIFAPELKTLSVSSCSEMKEIIQPDKFGRSAQVQQMKPFSNLVELKLINLPQVKSICGEKILPFPFLKRIDVIDCQNLKKLPLNIDSVPGRNVVITGGEVWWHLLNWENEATKEAFGPCFRAHKANRSFS